MKILKPDNTTNQLIKIIPREYYSSITLILRDDSTNEVFYYLLPTAYVNMDYLDISEIWELKEGRFYDLKVCKVQDDYEVFSEEVAELGESVGNNTFLLDYNNSEKLLKETTLLVLYKDKIFCTNQLINQESNNYYSVNKNDTKSNAGNNDYIVL
jgi:hypothetical protein